MASEFAGVSLGRQWQQKKRFGLTTEAQVFLGQTATQSRDSSLTYYKNADFTGAFNFVVGFFVRSSTLQASLNIGGLIRQTNFIEPTGYSFTPYKTRAIYFTRFDFILPITKSVKLLNQFSVPISSSSNSPGVVWLIGLKL